MNGISSIGNLVNKFLEVPLRSILLMLITQVNSGFARFTAEMGKFENLSIVRNNMVRME